MAAFYIQVRCNGAWVSVNKQDNLTAACSTAEGRNEKDVRIQDEELRILWQRGNGKREQKDIERRRQILLQELAELQVAQLHMDAESINRELEQAGELDDESRHTADDLFENLEESTDDPTGIQSDLMGNMRRILEVEAGRKEPKVIPEAEYTDVELPCGDDSVYTEHGNGD